MPVAPDSKKGPLIRFWNSICNLNILGERLKEEPRHCSKQSLMRLFLGFVVIIRNFSERLFSFDAPLFELNRDCRRVQSSPKKGAQRSTKRHKAAQRGTFWARLLLNAKSRFTFAMQSTRERALSSTSGNKSNEPYYRRLYPLIYIVFCVVEEEDKKL